MDTTDAASRTCRTCGEHKTYSEFNREKATADGWSWHCKSCRAAKNQEQYRKHAEKRREYAKAYAETHADQKSAYNRVYREENKDRLNEYVREWRKTNTAVRSEESKRRKRERMKKRYAEDPEYRDRIRAGVRAYRTANPDKAKETDANWRKNNQGRLREYARYYYRNWKTPEEKKEYNRLSRARHEARHEARRLECQHARRMKKDSIPGTITNAHLHWNLKWQDNCCYYCNRVLFEDNQKRHVEHVVPLERDGTNHPYNVVRACASCNCSKQDKIFSVEWSPESVVPVQLFHSTHCTALFREALAAAGATFKDCITHVEVADRPIFILSTFWMSSRVNPIETLDTLRSKHPKAVFFFDHEWRARPDSVLATALVKAGVSPSYGARELEIDAPSVEQAREFFDRWHIQGFSGGSWTIGLRRGDEWQAMAALKDTKGGYDLARMAFKGHIAGGMSRILQKFKAVAPEKKPIFSFCDLRFGDGGGYKAVGFTSTGDSLPVTAYTNGVSLMHWTVGQKQNLPKRDFYDGAVSDVGNLRANGAFRMTLLPRIKFVMLCH